MNQSQHISPSPWGKSSRQPDESQQHLDVEHLRDDLERRSVHSSVLMVASNATQLFVTTGSMMVLARLLTPKDFGLFAMVSVLTGLIGMLNNFGLPLAVVHQSRIDHRQISWLFWYNAKRNSYIVLLTIAAAPGLVWFFDEPGLLAIIVVLSLGMFILGLTNLHLGLLRRQMRFGTISVLEAVAVMTGAVVGIALAWQGAGYWALVSQQLAMLLVRAGFLWSTCRWRPSSRRELATQPDTDLQALVSYGKYTLYARLLSYIGDNCDRILVAGLAGASQLGLYYNAYRWSFFPVRQLDRPIKSIVIAGSSRLQGNPDQYRTYVRNIFLALLSVALPIVGFVCMHAHDVVLLLLGPQWLDAVPLLRIFSVAAAADCVRRLVVWVYSSEGQTKRRLYWTALSAPLRIVGIVVGAPWGALGIATGYTIAAWALTYPSVLFCLKTSPLRVRDCLGAAWRPTLAMLAATLLLLALQPVLPQLDSLPFRLVFHASSFAVAYITLWISMPGGLQSTRAILNLLKASTRRTAEVTKG